MSDQYVRVHFADDGQPIFDNWREGPIGEVGQYGLRITFTRLGSFRQRVVHVQCSSPRRRDLLGAVATLQPSNG